MSQHLSEGVVRRYCKSYFRSAKKSFPGSSGRYETGEIKNDINLIKEESDVVRVLVHTQPERIKALKAKKSHVAEIQLNGGTIEEKVDWALSRFEKEVTVKEVFSPQEVIDCIGVTKGHGFEGVTKRFGTRILPRKTNKGLRKVACIGAWHPSRVLWTVPRAGQMGFHRRTLANKRVYMMGNGREDCKTEFDLTGKGINPMGGFPHYGYVNSDFLMIKGGVMGPIRRVITLRKSLFKQKNPVNTEEIVIKFIDTSSKIGHGRFQTSEEKRAFFGAMKKKVTEISEK
jgi:large subunit ribosomal protein L3e